MQIVLQSLKRGQTEIERDNDIIDNRLFTATDIGIYFRAKRALETEEGIEFYINDKDEEVLKSLARLEEYEALRII